MRSTCFARTGDVMVRGKGAWQAESPKDLIASVFNLGNVYYADSLIGLSSNDGVDPQTPCLYLQDAINKCVDNHDDYVIARGSFSDSAVVIAKRRLHLFGLQQDGFGQEQLTRISSGASATGATILIQADDVEVGNLQAMGNRDPGKHYPAIQVNNNIGRAFLHDIYVPMLTPSNVNYCEGLNLIGNRITVQRCLIENSSVGIHVNELGGIVTQRIVLQQIVMRACNRGLWIEAVSEAIGQHGVMAEDLFIDGHKAETPGLAILVAAGNPVIRYADMCGYGATEALTLTKGNGKFLNCTWAGLTGVSSACT
jgi:hypothetical protein